MTKTHCPALCCQEDMFLSKTPSDGSEEAVIASTVTDKDFTIRGRKSYKKGEGSQENEASTEK